LNEALRGIIASGEKIGIAGGAVSLFSPNLEQKGALQDESVTVARSAETVEDSLETVLNQDQAEIRVALMGEIEQFLANGSGKVFWG
jgi:hypothetical protein